MLNGRCPKCESEKIVPNVAVGAPFGYVSLAVQKNPGAVLQRLARPTSEVTAAVCADCGYVELFAVAHQELWQAHEKHARP